VVSTSVRIPGDRSAPSAPCADACALITHARTGGWTKYPHNPPSSRNGDRISGAAGSISAASAAVSSGPVTKISSIITPSRASAVASSPGSSLARIRGHIAREIDPSGGMNAPAASASANSTPTGAPESPQTTSAQSATACTIENGTITRASPRRSISRPISGDVSPTARPNAAATAPADA
jgi:hypothetical protein